MYIHQKGKILLDILDTSMLDREIVSSKIDFIKSKIIKEEIVVVGVPYQEKLVKIVRSPFSSILLKMTATVYPKK